MNPPLRAMRANAASASAAMTPCWWDRSTKGTAISALGVVPGRHAARAAPAIGRAALILGAAGQPDGRGVVVQRALGGLDQRHDLASEIGGGDRLALLADGVREVAQLERQRLGRV